jgi:hypothetical protein
MKTAFPDSPEVIQASRRLRRVSSDCLDDFGKARFGDNFHYFQATRWQTCLDDYTDYALMLQENCRNMDSKELPVVSRRLLILRGFRVAQIEQAQIFAVIVVAGSMKGQE